MFQREHRRNSTQSSEGERECRCGHGGCGLSATCSQPFHPLQHRIPVLRPHGPGTWIGGSWPVSSAPCRTWGSATSPACGHRWAATFILVRQRRAGHAFPIFCRKSPASARIFRRGQKTKRTPKRAAIGSRNRSCAGSEDPAAPWEAAMADSRSRSGLARRDRRVATREGTGGTGFGMSASPSSG